MSAGTPTRQRWLVPVLVVVASLTVGVGLLAREVYSRPDAVPAGTAAGHTVTPATSTPLRPDQEPGPDTVELSPDAAAHPQQEAVRSVLQTYFSAINERNYAKWTTSVTSELYSSKPPQRFQADFRSTRDGSIRVYRIEPGTAGALRVLVGFTSTQASSEAPPDFKEPCIRWRLMMPLVREGNGLRVDKGSQNDNPVHEKC
ncbi:hypothetical protein [Amycolatopsis sp. NPDC059021]|uniref:hypothetical protein n=1 Tax=Amycolatopsis sp. NPDC059021 TaxID=3346704 RepID=UPI0036721B4B